MKKNNKIYMERERDERDEYVYFVCLYIHAYRYVYTYKYIYGHEYRYRYKYSLLLKLFPDMFTYNICLILHGEHLFQLKSQLLEQVSFFIPYPSKEVQASLDRK